MEIGLLFSSLSLILVVVLDLYSGGLSEEGEGG